MNEIEANMLIDEVLKLFEDADIEINTKMTLFAKVQNVIYEYVKDIEHVIDKLIKEAEENPDWKAVSALRCAKKELLS